MEEKIKENVFDPESFLFREPKLILEEELREPETYFQILEAISFGGIQSSSGECIYRSG